MYKIKYFIPIFIYIYFIIVLSEVSRIQFLHVFFFIMKLDTVQYTVEQQTIYVFNLTRHRVEN